MSDSDSDEQFMHLRIPKSGNSFADIVFTNVRDCYSTTEDLKCTYVIPNEATSFDNSGKIGLYKVGWDFVNESLSAVDVTETGKLNDEQTITFKAKDLPLDVETSEYYQFCFVNMEGTVRGMSTPFTFSNHCEELTVEAIENDLLLIQTRTTLLEKRLKNAAIEKNKATAERDQLSKDMNHLTELCTKHQKDLEIKDAKIKMLEESIKILEHRIIDEQLCFKNQLSEDQSIISSLQIELSTARKEVEEAKQKLQDSCFENQLLKENNSSLQNQLRDMVMNEATLNLEIKSKNVAVSQLKIATSALEKSHTQVTSKLKNIEENLNLQQNMLAAMTTSKAMATEELKRQICQYKKLEISKDNFLNEISRAKEALLKLESRNMNLKRENDLLLFERETSQQLATNLQNELDVIKEERLKMEEQIADLQKRIMLGADEYRKKYIEWHKAQKKLNELQDYIQGSIARPALNDSNDVDVCLGEQSPVSQLHVSVTKDGLNDEQKAKIFEEMENQLQKFKSSNSPTLLTHPAASSGNLLKHQTINDHADLEELHSNESEFFDVFDRVDHSDDFEWNSPHTKVLNLETEATRRPQLNVCPICEMLFEPSYDMLSHVDTHFYHECPMCSATFDKDLGFMNFQEHVYSHIVD